MRPAMTEDELYHHGVKGQRWGRRRYQNDDGSLTPEGEARYGKRPGFMARRKAKKEAKVKAAKMAKLREARKQKAERLYNEPNSLTRRLSDKELSQRIKRLENEKKYKQLKEEVRTPVQKKVNEALTNVGSKLLSDVAVSIGEHYVKRYLKKKNIVFKEFKLPQQGGNGNGKGNKNKNKGGGVKGIVNALTTN